MRDPIAEPDRTTHFFCQITFDRSAVGKDIEGGGGIFGGSPSSFGNPMSRKIDALLDR